ncbi:dihydrolipoyllysine-residue acetyltransferase component of pyruvate dehydrogenase complex [Sideroxyarcus emersonii]|uniref:Acetyltransferase component of pyruvate dehydrogenase complex n=1 Tax=Sideroxyarcus emersonii TaxID=2764705 RepID=A0AAN1XCQ5_9PROT|nr:dihydrolipoyllysine-residue acetyltransferase [Sideroxyarcus emersonii]BCK88712.1 dihydrolipoyllysine-residue acetyltransferase component of pyruvate dehydrogenase complex [Sideroxyarcus emersonii]
MAEIRQVLVPDIGNFKGVAVIEVAVKAGDKVSAEQALITVETDKATMDVPAPFDGVVKEVKVKVGDKVSEGDLIVLMQSSGAQAAAPAAAPAPQAAAPVAAAPAPAPAPVAAAAPAMPAATVAPSGGKAHASPSIRRFARELGVNLALVGGSGEKGRITKDDVQNFVKKSLAGGAAATGGGALPGLLPWPEVDFAKFGAVESKPLSRIKKLSGANLHRNWVMIPHVTQFEEADISEMEAFRKELGAEYAKQNIKITPLAFMLKACAITLKHFPDFCASLDAAGENLIVKKYIHIGVAVDTPDGLMVPVIRDVDQKGIVQLAKELGEVSARAREKKITAADMQGGCFTISSLGGIGGTSFTPIINAPEVAILGVSRSSMKPVWKDGEFVPRLMLPLSLSYDHRVIDGAAGARFTTYLAHVLSDMRRLAL